MEIGVHLLLLKFSISLDHLQKVIANPIQQELTHQYLQVVVFRIAPRKDLKQGVLTLQLQQIAKELSERKAQDMECP